MFAMLQILMFFPLGSAYLLNRSSVGHELKSPVIERKKKNTICTDISVAHMFPNLSVHIKP